MKLKCAHGKRVMVLSTTKCIHRSDGSTCNAELTVGMFKGYAPDVMLMSYIKENRHA